MNEEKSKKIDRFELRIDEELKQKLKKDADNSRKTMTQIVEEELRARYSDDPSAPINVQAHAMLQKAMDLINSERESQKTKQSSQVLDSSLARKKNPRLREN